ncbi:hypothetical protein [Microbacterium aurantiacum]|uniref:hypothetical protein n=1 Tax=Microbacterium aurantiacum TaxID=162393 RepID=UPI00342381C4
MSTPWADATRIADDLRAELDQDVADAGAAITSVAPMVWQFLEAIRSHPDVVRDFRFIATGEWSPTGTKDATVEVKNPYEPERLRTFAFSLD